MRKSLLIISTAFLTCLVSFLLFNKLPASISNSEDEMQKELDHEDGKLQEQELEIRKTRDVNLGYVPKNKLIASYLKLLDTRNSLKAKKTPQNFPGFLWQERGPKSDIVGPSNGNLRANNGIASGRIRAVWVDLSDPSNKTVWVGGVDGGIWKSNDITVSPANWSPVNDFFSNLGVTTICQDPHQTNVMYFATGEKTLNVDATRGGGVWKSTDHGVSWQFLFSTINYLNASKIICDGAGNIYLATMSQFNSGLYRSSDGGISWLDVTPSGVNRAITDLKLSSTGRMHIVCGYNNGVFDASPAAYMFTDHPATVSPTTWTTPLSTVFNPAYNVELAVSGNTVYALPCNSSFQTPQIYKSIDGGDHWAATPTSPPVNSSISSLSAQQGWYDLALAVDPVNPNNVIAGGLNCYTSSDGGNTWKNISSWVGATGNYIHADQHTAVWVGNQVLIGCDGGLFYSGNGAVTFTDRNDGLRIKQLYSCAIHPTSTNYFLAGAQDNGTHQFSLAGLAGTTEVIGGDGGFVHIDQDEPQFQFCSNIYNNYNVSKDGGSSWQSVQFSSNGTFINPYDYDDIGNKLYAAYLPGKLLRWEDPQTGTTFKNIALNNLSGQQISCIKVSPFTPGTLFVGSEVGGIIKLTNSNANSPSEKYIGDGNMSGSYISNIELGTSESNLICSISNYGQSHVWNSADGGTTWNDISGNLPDMPVRWAMYYPEDNTKAIIATELGVWETSFINGANTVWVNDPAFPIVRTDMLQFRVADGTIAAATHGRGLWTSKFSRSTPFIRFATNYNIRSEQGNATIGCRSYHDYTINMNMDIPASGNSNVSLSVDNSSTATLGIDYDFTTNGDFIHPSSSLTFNSGSNLPQPVTVRIYDDAEVENQEFFKLNYTISGGSNAQIAPSSSSFTFFINDNDLAPLPNTGTIPGNNNPVNNESPFTGNLLRSRLQVIYNVSELKAAGITPNVNINSLGIKVITKNSTKPFSSFTINMANISNTSFSNNFQSPSLTQVYSASYSTVQGVNTFSLTSPFVWDGISNILIQFCFDNTGGVPDGLPDLVDGSDDPLFGGYASAYANPNNLNGSSCLLTSAILSLRRMSINFGLNNGNDIETIANNPSTVYLASAGDYYFYNASNKILAYTKSLSSLLGCTTVNISESGNTWQPFNTGLRSQKVFDVSSPQNTNQTYKLGLYVTATELGGQSPSLIKIAVTTATTGSAASSSNSTSLPTSYVPYANGYVFSTSTNKFAKFFLVNNQVTLPIGTLNFSGKIINDHSELMWQTLDERDVKNFDVERSSDGIQFYKIGSLSSHLNSAHFNEYHFVDQNLAPINYYRLKINDLNSKYSYSRIIILKTSDFLQKIWVEQNPFSDHIDIGLKVQPADNIICQLYTYAGNKLLEKTFVPADHLHILLTGLQIAKGAYVLRVISQGKIYTSSLIKK